LGNEALRPGEKILRGIADNPTVNARNMISKNVTDSLQNLISKMRKKNVNSRNPKRAKREAPT
jgi:hypothetical protein